MTVYKNMAFGLKLRKYPRAEIDQRVREAAAMLGLENLLDRKPKALSGGQRQRVAVGRAIVRQPQAFLFDEPLSNLDAKLRVQTRAELKRLHHRLQTTTIYVTHDQEEAMTLGDRIVVMKDGLVQQCDTPLNVYDYPSNRFVAGFVGTPPMNFIKGRIEISGGNAYFLEYKDGTPGGRILLTEAMKPIVEQYGEKEIVFGVRPDNITLENRSNEKENAWEVNVDVVEPLGERMDVYVATQTGQTMVARMDAHYKLAPDQKTTMYMTMNQVHLFETGDTGANLTLNIK
jgi:multiple sugar transport system ATP-binding protein